ncbi:hypothetical protein CBR_g8736 [Chara braunii]|uniref:Methyltransferase domain-containing protein n=1 Tax=Chara braunii TaxID=69332 RepID=A0A388KMN0_CHABU|nr:hypothetical protein CBR_g8736 [Chara braunii]|eukprot:GBG71314.1 hypothetical protein CBR_g8736 [Chara braunii]
MTGSVLGMPGQLANESIAEYRQRLEAHLALIEAEEQRQAAAEAACLQAEAAATAEKQRLQAEAEADTQEFVRGSKFPVWDKCKGSGVWRMLSVREGRAASLHTLTSDLPPDHHSPPPIEQVMLVVQCCPKGIDEKELSEEYKRMSGFLADRAHSCDPPLPLTALVVQHYDGVSNSAPADCPLIPLLIPKPKVPEHMEVADGEPQDGEPLLHIHEHLAGLKFRISPTAFFQVNTSAAERLYALAGDWAKLGPTTLLFDVCCGTGTIGLTLAHRVGKVIGIELNEAAVADANVNAEINQIKNCEFVAGKAEAVMDRLLQWYSSDIAAVGTDSADRGAAVTAVTVSPRQGGTEDIDDRRKDDESSTKTVILAQSREDNDINDAVRDKSVCGASRIKDLEAEKTQQREVVIPQAPRDASSCALGQLSPDGTTQDGDAKMGLGDHPLRYLGTNLVGPEVVLSNSHNEPIGKSTGEGIHENEGGVKKTGVQTLDSAVKDGMMQQEMTGPRPTTINDETPRTNPGSTPQGKKYSDVVAIVDPPRGGLHPTVLRNLRTHSRIRRLVYVSCNVETLAANAIELCTPLFDDDDKSTVKGSGGGGWYPMRGLGGTGLAKRRLQRMPDSEPFTPVKAMAVDLFPHTPHCEVVMLFER